MPAAAVIPAPIAYIKVVAVKKLVVGLLRRVGLVPSNGLVTRPLFRWGNPLGYCEEIRVFKAGYRLNTSAWNNKLRLVGWQVPFLIGTVGGIGI